MAIQEFTINFPGQNNITPRIGHLYAPNDLLVKVTSAGFLDNYIQSQNFSLLPSDCILVVASNGRSWYRPVFTNGSCQLIVF